MFFPISSPCGCSNTAGLYPNLFPNTAGQSYSLLNLTCPKISINFNIFNNPYKQHLSKGAPDPKIHLQNRPREYKQIIDGYGFKPVNKQIDIEISTSQ